jgi:hypothetical protein
MDIISQAIHPIAPDRTEKQYRSQKNNENKVRLHHSNKSRIPIEIISSAEINSPRYFFVDILVLRQILIHNTQS